MNKPISDPILTIQNRKKTDFSTYNKTPPGPLIFKKIASGPNSGYYTATSLDGSVVMRQGNPTIYTKAFFQPKEQPKYLYADYLPFYDGFYYIPKSEIPIRKLIYGLQNYDLPTSGNIEKYIPMFNRISVPKEFCPFIDPCVYDWCNPCEQMRIRKTEKYRLQPKKGPPLQNYIYLMSLICIVSLIATLAVGL